MIKKVYDVENCKMYPFKLRKVGREKQVYFTADGQDAFIRWNNKRVYTTAFMDLSYPVFYIDDNGKTGHLDGYISLCNFGGVYVEILDGEYVQLWEEVTND